MNTKAIGEKSEAIIMTEFIKNDIPVMLPFGDNQRYDMVIEINGKFLRIQCKTGRLLEDVIDFPSSSSSAHRSGGRKGYVGEADFFGVYCPDTNAIYLVDVSRVGSSNVKLRLKPSKNNQTARVNFAKDFEFNKVLNDLLK